MPLPVKKFAAKSQAPEAKVWDWPLQHNDGMVSIVNTKERFEADLEIPMFRANEIDEKQKKRTAGLPQTPTATASQSSSGANTPTSARCSNSPAVFSPPSIAAAASVVKKTRNGCTFENQDVARISKDINALCAVLFTMGIWENKDHLEYWHNQRGLPAVYELMSQDRFRFMCRNLCLRDVDDEEPTDVEKKNDRAWKIRPFFEEFRKCCRKIEAEEHQCIDEQMITFRGKNIMHQYMPKKPIKYGFKTHARAGKSGFVYDVDVATGKATEKQRNDAQKEGLQLTSKIVVDLVDKMPPGYKNVKLLCSEKKLRSNTI